MSQADLASDGIPATHHGDYAFYGVMDQMLWRDSRDPDGDRSVSFFARAMGAPEEDRNLIDFQLECRFYVP